jgi:hypothetical protein
MTVRCFDSRVELFYSEILEELSPTMNEYREVISIGGRYNASLYDQVDSSIKIVDKKLTSLEY